MMKKSYKLQSTYSSFQNNLHKLDLKLYPSKVIKKTTDKYIVIILDTSGSMSGGKIDSCKQTLKDLITYSHQELKNNKIDLIEFNSQSFLHEMFNQNLETQLQVINKMKAGGGTAMRPVFSKTVELLEKRKEEVGHICMIFLTDGQPDEQISEIESLSRNLRQFVNSKFQSVDVHSLGYGADHNPSVCLALTEASTGQGTFQYVQDIQNIQQCINSIAGSLGDKVLMITFKFDDESHTIRCLLKEDENGKQYYQATKIFKCQKSDLLIKLATALIEIQSKKGNNQVLHISNLSENEVIDNGQENLRVQFQNYNEEMKKLTKSLSTNQKIENELIQSSNQLISKFAIEIFNLKKEIFKFPIKEQMNFKQQYEDIMEYATKLRTVLTQATNGLISSETIAQINSMAFRSTVKENLSKKLDKRIIKNAGQTNQMLNAVNQLDFQLQDLEKKYPNMANDYGCCYIDLTSVLETIQQKNCFCITFDLIRPEAAINDPSRIQILSINPTYISSGALFDCIKFHLEIDPKNFGGFNKQNKGIQPMVGKAGDKITGAMPIFICEENWQIGSKLILPILGWVTTLDTNGFDVQQLKAIPFMLFYYSYVNKDKSEFNLKMYNDLAVTCKKILEENQDFQQHLINCVKNYATQGDLRSAGNIISNELFLKQILFLSDQKILNLDESELRKILLYSFEEDIRRRLRKSAWNKDQSVGQLFQLMGMDVKEKILEIEKQFGEQIIQLIQQGQQLTITPEIQDFIQIKDSLFVNIQEISSSQKQSMKEFYKIFEQMKKQYQKWFKEFCPSSPNLETLQDLNIECNSQALLLYYQNKIHTQNEKRVQSFIDKSYVDFTDKNACIQFFKQFYQKNLWDIIVKSFKQKYKLPSVAQSVINQFAETQDLEVAKQTLQNYFDLKSLQVLFSILRRNKNCQLVYQKLNLIITGINEKNIKFEKKPLKKCLKKLYSKYKSQCTYEEWKKLWYKEKKIEIQ